MKIRYKGDERKFMYGRWFNPGEVIENDALPNDFDFEEVKEKKRGGE